MSSDQPSAVPTRSFSQRICSRICAVIGTVTLLAVVSTAGAEVFAWLLPQRLSDDGRWYVRFAAASTYIRVFQFHIGIVTLALAVVLLGVRWRGSAFMAAILSLILLCPYGRDLAPKNPPAAASATIRLMSMNLYFKNHHEAAILSAIEAANPDVIVLLEVTPWSAQTIITNDLLGRYAYINQPRVDGGGVVLSRVPCRVGKSVPSTDGSLGRSPVVLEIGGREVSLYAVHLVSPGRARLVGRNRKQVTLLSEIARDETRSTIIAGDCNFSQLTPNAASFRRAGLRSSHELIGFGLGDTWSPRWWPFLNRLPGVRIDHIWLSPELTVTTHAIGLDTGSDHRPVIADIALSQGRTPE